MARSGFAALAAILKEHQEALQLVDDANIRLHGSNCTSNALAFSRLMSHVRTFCKERNPRFDVAKFDAAVWGDGE